MIIPYNKKELIDLLEFIKNNINDDFYITKNNERLIIKDYITLNLFLKECFHIYIDKDEEINGVIALWKGKAGNIIRNYVKINAKDKKTADRLVDILVANHNVDLYIKIKKSSEFVEVLKRRSFKFLGDRGSQLLLFRKKNVSESLKS